MAIRILTKNGIENTNIDGARDNNFNAGRRSGISKGVLNEGNLYGTSNTLTLEPCELRLCGHRVVIDENETRTFTNKPQTETKQSLISQIQVDGENVTFELIVQNSSTALVQDNLDINGNGTYQLEIGTFTQNTDGTISDVVRTAELISGSEVTQSQIDGINKTIKNKANADLSNVTYPQVVADGLAHTGAGDRVVETYIKTEGTLGNKIMYRKWASGWKECILSTYNTNVPINSRAEAVLPLKFTDATTVIAMVTSREWLDAPLYTHVYRAGQTSVHFGTITSDMEGQYVAIGLSGASGQACTNWQLYCCGY